MARRESSWAPSAGDSKQIRQIAEASGQVISDNREMVKGVCSGPGGALTARYEKTIDENSYRVVLFVLPRCGITIITQCRPSFLKSLV